MYELVELNTFMYDEKVIAKSLDLNKLRKYAFEKYCNNNDPEYDKEIYVNENGILYKYENRGGQYQGSGYKNHGLIRIKKVDEDVLIIE